MGTFLKKFLVSFFKKSVIVLGACLGGLPIGGFVLVVVIFYSLTEALNESREEDDEDDEE